jgi:hypothetical protein
MEMEMEMEVREAGGGELGEVGGEGGRRGRWGSLGSRLGCTHVGPHGRGSLVLVRGSESFSGAAATHDP